MKFDKKMLEEIKNTIPDETYHFGGTTVHVIAPKNITDEERDFVLEEFKKANIELWKSILEERALNLASTQNENHTK